MILLYAASAFVGAIVFLFYSIRRLKPYRSIPAFKHPFYNILGDLIHADLTKELGVQVFEIFEKKRKHFLKEPLVCVWLSYLPIPVAMRSDAAREILKENKIIDKSFHYEWLKHVFGTGLITSASGKWKTRRKLFNPCFHYDVLRNYMETFNIKSRNLVNTLQKETQRDFCDILEPLTLCAFDTVCETIFGSSVIPSEEDKIKASNSLKMFTSIVMERTYSFWLWPDFIFWKTKLGKVFKNNTINAKAFFQKLIEEKKKRFLNGERTIYNGKHKPLIDVLLEKHLETQEFSEEDVSEEVITFLSAGHDTVGLAVMWSLYLIGQHPDVQKRLHEEVDRVFGEDRERATTEADFKDLQFMDCVLKESFRLYPTVPFLGRTVSEETKICGFTLPKGTTCCISIYGLHRDENVFQEPAKFNPDRFSYENRVKIPEFAYIPFSGGPRNCIGYKFAEMEVGTIMSWILRFFTVETLNKVVGVPGISLHPSKPVRIKIRSREINKI